MRAKTLLEYLEGESSEIGAIFTQPVAGPDAGRAGGYYDGEEFDGVTAKALATVTGCEMLTEQLKRELMDAHPHVLTPGIWAFKSEGGAKRALLIAKEPD